MQTVGQAIQALSKLLLLPNDAVSVFKPKDFIEPSAKRNATWHTCDMSVVDLKRIGYVVLLYSDMVLSAGVCT